VIAKHNTPSDAGCGCGTTCLPASPEAAGSALVKLPIVWQRLVSEGQTCQRCGSTQEAIEHAMVTLTEALRPLGIEPELETRTLDQAAFEADPVRIEPHLDRRAAHRGLGRRPGRGQPLLLGVR
jgi:hypothetical protein